MGNRPHQNRTAPPQQLPPGFENIHQLAPQERKRKVGDYIYPKIATLYADQAGKLTGMILELETPELIQLLQNESALLEKASQAHEVLQKHTTTG